MIAAFLDLEHISLIVPLLLCVFCPLGQYATSYIQRLNSASLIERSLTTRADSKSKD